MFQPTGSHRDGSGGSGVVQLDGRAHPRTAATAATAQEPAR